MRRVQSPLLLLDSCQSIKQAFQIHAQIVVNGLHDCVSSFNKLIRLFALSGVSGLRHSSLLLTQMDQPNLFIWNTMIRGYSRSQNPEKSLALYKLMLKQGVLSPNGFTFPFLLNACSKSSCIHVQEIHSHVIKNGFVLDVFVKNSLIHCYVVLDDVNSAHQLFVESSIQDVVSFNTMIKGFSRRGLIFDTMNLFRKMMGLAIEPDEFTYVALLSSCSISNDGNTGKSIHLFICKRLGVDNPSTLLQNALIDMYAKCGMMEMANRIFYMKGLVRNTLAWTSMISGFAKCGRIDLSRQMFDEMPERDLISWTSMIGAYSQAGQYCEALRLFQEMEDSGLKPDEVTIVTALTACAQLGALDFGMKLHKQIENELMTHNIILSTSIVNMYAKCGSIDRALEIFSMVSESSKSVFMFNSVISGLAQHGLGKEAVTVFNKMVCIGLKPDEATFVGLLCACSHGGLIKEGKKLFDVMMSKHNIKPQIEHYGCMVDLLGRGGLLMEALDFVEKMPVKANYATWASLLSSCRNHGNLEIGEIAAQMLHQLDPNHGSHYVLLSNIRANANRWEDSSQVRRLMNDGQISKPPGWSYIELNCSIHQFIAHDKSHPQIKEIESMLEEINKKLRSIGFVHNTEFVFFNIEDEEKENSVSHHSEKLALAFGLLYSDPNATIRIVKNLRTCRDCHLSFKLVSEIYRRDIIVRDRIRFHHFKDGSCSCRDYW